MNEIQGEKKSFGVAVTEGDFDTFEDGVWEKIKKEKESFYIYMTKCESVELDQDFLGEEMIKDNISSLIANFEEQNFMCL